ncbi:MotA/TolQ/ExbB proton channel family protein [Candidatus Methylacidiphilum infernorum]|uniref:MotA/TolQ/ExbB proton channel family protein n=1 Tax=Methylacidiphilum infernorum (isolate V4) TaxID=481448 RepID=B3DUH1_METI4|nr:MotA/TolQ/ExbB proton channel family protein [Candidatus Methylacidiphilum infernorum]ACD82974.1 MotA/TolQ/ExbB proton channel family protein [Methylacidiphilum infernorum V4]
MVTLASINWNQLPSYFAIKNFVEGSGLFIYPVILCSIVGLAIILERSFSLRRSKIIPKKLVKAIEELGWGENPEPIEKLCQDQKSPLSRLVYLCLQNMSWSKYENSEALQVKARAEIAQLEKGLVILEIIVGIGPLLGLLGTLSGLITIFGNVGVHGMATQGAAIAHGISEALHTTFAGLGIAVPCLIAHSLFTRKVEAYAVEMETLCSEFLAKIYTEAPAPEDVNY